MERQFENFVLTYVAYIFCVKTCGLHFHRTSRISCEKYEKNITECVQL